MFSTLRSQFTIHFAILIPALLSTSGFDSFIIHHFFPFSPSWRNEIREPGITTRDCNHHQLQFFFSCEKYCSSHLWCRASLVRTLGCAAKSYYFIWIILPWRMCNKQKHRDNDDAEYYQSITTHSRTDESLLFFPCTHSRQGEGIIMLKAERDSIGKHIRRNLRFLFDLLLFTTSLVILAHILLDWGIPNISQRETIKAAGIVFVTSTLTRARNQEWRKSHFGRQHP